MTDAPLPIAQVAEELRGHLNEMMQALISDPVRQAVDRIPGLLQRQDWTDQQKTEAIQMLQLALVTPFLNAAVNAAQACRMPLSSFLNYTGAAWEEIRGRQMAHIAEEMLNRNTPKE